MTIKLGSLDASAFYLGSTSVSALYLGSTQVWGGASAVPDLPSGALGLYVMSDVEGSVRKVVPNRMVAGVTRDPNLAAPGRRVLSDTNIYGAGGPITVTDNAVAAPDGSMEASTLVVPTAEFWIWRQGAVAVPAGVYTFCLTVKNLDAGADPTVFFGPLSAGDQPFVIGKAWQRLKVTSGAGFTGADIGLLASVAVNLAICDLEVFAGSEDLRAATWATEKPVGCQRMDLFVGHKLAHASTVSSGALAAGSSGFLPLDQAHSMGAFTVVAVVKKTTGTLDDVWQTLLEGRQRGTQSNYYDNFGVGPASPVQPGMKLNGSSFGTRAFSGLDQNSHSSWGANKSGPFVTMHRWDGALGSSWINGVKLLENGGSVTPPSISDMMVNYGANAPSGYEIHALVIYLRALSDAEMVQAYTALTEMLPALSAARKRIHIVEGDSITAANNKSGEFIEDAWGMRPAIAGSVTVGAPGSISLEGRKAGVLDIIAKAIAAGQEVVVTSLIGANDLPGSGVQADRDAWLANYLSYLTDLREAGAKVVPSIVLPQGPGTFGTDRTAFNAARAYINPKIRQWKTDGLVDEVCDYDTDPSLATVPADPTYFPDGVHPGTAGYTLMNPILGAAVGRLG